MSDLLLSDSMLRPPPELEEAWAAVPAVVKVGTPVLRQVAPPIARITAETRALVERMTHIMRTANGIGIAAPQVGVSQRLFIYELEKKLYVVINPEIVEATGEQIGLEGCLSIPGLYGNVSRFNEIRLKGYDLRGRPFNRKLTEFEARVVQHEKDHLDGVLFIDKAIAETLEWVFPQDEEGEEHEAKLRSRRGSSQR